jgi:ATP-dependent DNA helicase RecG
MLELNTSVQYVKGIGPRIAALLAEKGIATVEDLLYYLPFRYEDRINPRSIAQLQPGEMASVIGEVRTSGLFRTSRTHTPIFQLTVADPGGRVPLKSIWFNATYLQDKFKPGALVALYGKVDFDTFGRGGLQMVQPQLEFLDEEKDDANVAAGESLETGRVVPIYESAGHGRLTPRWFRRVIHNTLRDLAPELPDGLPTGLRERLQLLPLRDAFWQVHWPDPGERFEDLQNARTPAHRRLIFEELFFLELGLELKRRRVKAQPGIGFEINNRVRESIKRILPFHPTTAQKRVLKEIAGDMQAAVPMRRLLQGDVGSGKTIVAFEAAIIALENGYQVALMAPTEILAMQHYLSARRMLEASGYRIVLLTGSVQAGQKRSIRRHISQGDAQLVIGTHALIEETVEFARLGLVIVDEQHRFGVMQRFKLMKKPAESAPEASPKGGDDQPGAPKSGREDGPPAAGTPAPEPDVMVMTATPIPRTLALTLYGDLDVSVIDELPPGRTPIVTRRVSDEKSDQVWEFVRRQIKAGHQAYVVYPIIEEQGTEQANQDGWEAEERPQAPSSVPESRGAGFHPSEPKSGAPGTPGSADGRTGLRSASRSAAGAGAAAVRTLRQQSLWAGLKAAVPMYERLRREVFPDLRLGLLHGRLSAEEKESAMARFQRGEIDLLVSTTVIEVGVDVANANVMVIEHAERFGLSQLHQLRGRIGRGAAKSYCILMTGGKTGEEADLRLDAMVRTRDGFEIAELDLQLRGPGEFFGTRQAGLPDFRVSNLVRDRELLQLARQEAATVAAGPEPNLSREEMGRVFTHLRTHWQRRYGLVEVG